MAVQGKLIGKIDYDRGVTFSVEPSSGMNVYMYDNEPGVYRNIHGLIISAELAKKAGFDIEKYGKEKIKRERMAIAMSAIEAELEHVPEAKKTPIRTKCGFKIMDIGLERYNVEDPDGNVLNTVAMSKPIADTLFDQLTKECKEDEKKVAKVK